jgi:ABC-type polysaccharide/polyol phosphate export permease
MKTSETVIYDSAKRGPAAIEELRAVFQYRDFINQLVQRDIVARYKRSVLGVAWTMLQPLGMMLVISIVFSQIFDRIEGYSVYLLSGLIAFTFFSQTTSAIIRRTVWGNPLVEKIYMPKTTFAISAIGTGLVNIAFSLVPMVIIMAIAKIPIRWSLLFLPVSMLLLAAFALGVGLFVSTLAVFFPDVSEMFDILLRAWWYLTPIIYPVDRIPVHLQKWFMLNPMYFFVQLFRIPIYEGAFPSTKMLAIGIAFALLTLVVGWLLFTAKSDEFSYRT